MRSSTRKFFYIMFALAACIVMVGVALILEFWSYAFTYVMIGIGVVMIIGLGIVYGVIQNRPRSITIEREVVVDNDHREQANEIYKQRVEEAIQRAIGKQERVPITENMNVIEYTKAPDKDVCMVCKLFLNEKDKILQCPVCESLYHRDHLLEWITVKKKCPVCSQILCTK